MTVESETYRAQYGTNGTTGPWTVPFYFLADADLRVIYTDATGNETTLTLTTDYSVTGSGDPTGGSITTVSAYTAGGYVTILRNVQLLQETDYTEGDGFPAESHERALDRLTMIAQQQAEVLGRSLVYGAADTGASELPTVADRAGRLLAFNDSTGAAEASAFTTTQVASAVAAAYAAGSTADAVTFIQAGTGAVSRSVNDKSRDAIHAADFGAVGTGDETAKLKAAFDYAIPLNRTVVLSGSYTVSGTISNNSTLASGSLHIHCDGDVTITVDAASTAFNRLLSCETTAANNISITGGTLSIVGNSKVGTAVYARHYGQGGQVNISALKVTGCKQAGASVIENAGLYILGRYRIGSIGTLDVDGVDRANSATASRGLLIQDVEGPFTVRSLRVSNVLSTGFSADADGLYFSGYTSGASTTQRAGSLTVERAEFTDCQGRSIKAQAQDIVIRDCIIRRQLVTTFSVPDLDFQLGGGQIDTLQLNYFKNGGTSPLHASFYPIASQHNCTDRATTCRIGKVTVRSEVQLPRLTQVIVGATALDGGTLIDDVDLIPYNGFTGSFFARCVAEFDAGQVAASSNKTHISVRNVRGEMSGIPILGHTAFAATVATKLSVDAIGNNNTGTPSSGNKTIAAVSGSDIPAFLAFNFRDNAGFHGLMMSTFAFDTQKLASGCRFSYIRATATVTNGPAIAAGTYVDVECLGSINGTSRKVRMTVDNAGTMDEWYTQSGAWGVIK